MSDRRTVACIAMMAVCALAVGACSTTTAEPASGVTYVNNTGVEQSVYLEGTVSGVVLNSGVQSPHRTGAVGTTESVYIVPAGGAIRFAAAPSAWTWIGN